ncbi:hypothetical protein C8J57DRAFT_638688 [Mycena rebaudengoi]|nr:hypothetical protein C8J57DRAFT_638688 [Mycena rebaudengoi]
MQLWMCSWHSRGMAVRSSPVAQESKSRVALLEKVAESWALQRAMISGSTTRSTMVSMSLPGNSMIPCARVEKWMAYFFALSAIPRHSFCPQPAQPFRELFGRRQGRFETPLRPAPAATSTASHLYSHRRFPQSRMRIARPLPTHKSKPAHPPPVLIACAGSAPFAMRLGGNGGFECGKIRRSLHNTCPIHQESRGAARYRSSVPLWLPFSSSPCRGNRGILKFFQ